MDVTSNIYLKSMKYKRSLIFGSTYIVEVIFAPVCILYQHVLLSLWHDWLIRISKFRDF